MASNGNKVEAPRFEGVHRPYSNEAVKKLQGSLKIEHTLAKEGSKKLWVQLYLVSFLCLTSFLSAVSKIIHMPSPSDHIMSDSIANSSQCI